MAVETLYLSALASDDPGQITGASAAFGSATGTWTTNIDNDTWDGHFDLDSTSGAPVASQTVTVRMRVRKQDGTSDPTIDIIRFRNGTTIRGENTTGWNVTSLTGQTITATISASGITGDGSDLTLEIETTAAGGSPAKRAAVQLDYVEVDVETSADKSGTGSISHTSATTASGSADRSGTASIAHTSSVVGPAPPAGFGDILQTAYKTSDLGGIVELVLSSAPTDGNLLLGIVYTKGNTEPSAAVGWGRESILATGDGDYLTVFWKIADGDTASQSFFHQSGQSVNAILYEVKAGDGGIEPYFASGSTYEATSGTTITAPNTLTTPDSGAEAVYFAVVANDAYIQPSSWTNSFTTHESVQANNLTVSVGTRVVSARTNTNTTFTQDTANTERLAVMFAATEKVAYTLPLTENFTEQTLDPPSASKWTVQETDGQVGSSIYVASDGLKLATAQTTGAWSAVVLDPDITTGEDLEIDMLLTPHTGSANKWLYVALRSSGDIIDNTDEDGRPDDAYYIRLKMDSNSQETVDYLMRRINSTESGTLYTIGNGSNTNRDIGQPFRFKMRVSDSGSDVLIEWKMWDADASEPGSWDSYTDTTPGALLGTQGTFSLHARNYSSSESLLATVDNLTVSAYSTSPDKEGTGTIAHASSTTSTGAPAKSGTGTAAHASSTASTGEKGGSGTGTIAHTSSTTATGQVTIEASGSGTISAASSTSATGERATDGTGTISHASSTSASGTAVEEASGSGTIAAASSTSGTGQKDTSGTGTISGASSTSASGTAIEEASGTASITHASSTSASGIQSVSGNGSITHASSTSGVGEKSTGGTASIAHSTATTATGNAEESAEGTASISNTHTTSAAGQKDTSGATGIGINLSPDKDTAHLDASSGLWIANAGWDQGVRVVDASAIDGAFRRFTATGDPNHYVRWNPSSPTGVGLGYIPAVFNEDVRIGLRMRGPAGRSVSIAVHYYDDTGTRLGQGVAQPSPANMTGEWVDYVFTYSPSSSVDTAYISPEINTFEKNWEIGDELDIDAFFAYHTTSVDATSFTPYENKISVSASGTPAEAASGSGTITHASSTTASGTAVEEASGTGTVTGASSTVASGQKEATGGGVASHTSATTATGSADRSGSGSIGHTSSATATGTSTETAVGSGTITHASSTAASGQKEASSSPTISAASGTASTGQKDTSGTGTLAATSSATATGSGAREGTGAVTHSSSITATGAASGGNDASGTGSISAATSTSASGQKDAQGTGALSATSDTSAQGAGQRSGSGALSATSSTSASGGFAIPGSGSIEHTATTSASGIVGIEGTASISVTHAPTVQGAKQAIGVGLINALQTTTATGSGDTSIVLVDTWYESREFYSGDWQNPYQPEIAADPVPDTTEISDFPLDEVVDRVNEIAAIAAATRD